MAAVASSSAAVSLPPHPRLLLSTDGVAALKQRIVAAQWAKSSWQTLQQSAAESVENPVTLPPRGGNWSHNFVCPTHGARLK